MEEHVKKHLFIVDIDGTIFDIEKYQAIRNSKGNVDWRQEGRRLSIPESKRVLNSLSEMGDVVYLTARRGHINTEGGSLTDVTLKWLSGMRYPKGPVLTNTEYEAYNYKKEAIITLLDGKRPNNAIISHPDSHDFSTYSRKNYSAMFGFGNEIHDILAYLENGVVPLIYTGNGNPNAGDVLKYIGTNKMEGIVYTFNSWEEVMRIIDDVDYNRWLERSREFIRKYLKNRKQGGSRDPASLRDVNTKLP